MGSASGSTPLALFGGDLLESRRDRVDQQVEIAAQILHQSTSAAPAVLGARAVDVVDVELLPVGDHGGADGS